MIKNIIFDWAGVISDNLENYHKICQIIFKKLGREGPSIEDIKENFTIPYMKFWNHFFPDMTLEEQNRLFSEALRIVGRAKIHKECFEVLDYLYNRGINLFVVSSDSSYSLLPEAKEGKIDLFFTRIYTNIDEKESTLKEIIQKYDTKQNETLYVGDTSGDVEAGKNVGVKTVGITWGFQDEARLRSSNPDYIINNISELIELVK